MLTQQQQMQPTEPPQFLPVPQLIEHSRPHGRRGLFKYALGGFVGVVLLSAIVSGQSPEMQALVRVMSALVMIGLLVTMGVLFTTTVRRHRAEQAQVAAVEELVQLRRWPQAAIVLEGLLSRPMLSQQTRVHSLIYLATVLARYHRYEDAIGVYEYVLDHVQMDERASHAIRLGRAMSMLHADHLVDADRAMGEIRRQVGDNASAGLALLDIYRDVKTGHPAEAVEIFESQLPTLREQLGHRVADAYALAARAYDMLGRTFEAARAYENATLLSPSIELHRRYRELAAMVGRYQPAAAPAEAA